MSADDAPAVVGPLEGTIAELRTQLTDTRHLLDTLVSPLRAQVDQLTAEVDETHTARRQERALLALTLLSLNDSHARHGCGCLDGCVLEHDTVRRFIDGLTEATSHA